MKIFVDADSCPPRVREIVIKACNSKKVPAVFIANRDIPGVKTPFSTMIVVPPDPEAVDTYIVEHVSSEDMVITRDIPLAHDLVTEGVTVLNDRGTVFDFNSIRERLSLRDISKSLRESGIYIEESDRFGKRDIKAFADSFDRELHRKIK